MWKVADVFQQLYNGNFTGKLWLMDDTKRTRLKVIC